MDEFTVAELYVCAHIVVVFFARLPPKPDVEEIRYCASMPNSLVVVRFADMC